VWQDGGRTTAGETLLEILDQDEIGLRPLAQQGTIVNHIRPYATPAKLSDWIEPTPKADKQSTA
jgi:hypothetical protein